MKDININPIKLKDKPKHKTDIPPRNVVKDMYKPSSVQEMSERTEKLRGQSAPRETYNEDNLFAQAAKELSSENSDPYSKAFLDHMANLHERSAIKKVYPIFGSLGGTYDDSDSD